MSTERTPLTWLVLWLGLPLLLAFSVAVSVMPTVQALYNDVLLFSADMGARPYGPRGLSLLDVGTRHTRPLTAAYDNDRGLYPTVNPADGSVAFVTPDGIQATDGFKAEPVSLIDIPQNDTVRGLAWSPDGSRLAYLRSTNFGQVVEVKPRGAPPDWLTRPIVIPRAWLAWSPDSRQVMYLNSSSEESIPELVAIDVGTGDQQVLNRGEWVRGGAWSPDGSQVAFVTTTAVHLVNADGTANRRVIRLPNLGDQIAWAPDGEAFAIPAFVQRAYTIMVYDVAAQSARVFTNPLPETMRTTPLAWSSDGMRIAYMHRRDLYTLGVHDGRIRRLTYDQPFALGDGRLEYRP